MKAKGKVSIVKNYTLNEFFEKALTSLMETGYAINKEKLQANFSLEGNKTRCLLIYEDGLLNIFAAGDTPDIALHDLSLRILKKTKPKVDPILTL
jgi:hypothetical protein